MTFEVFMCLLAIIATATSLITEGVKKTLEIFNVRYVTNIVVLCVSIVVGGLGTCVFYLWHGYDWSMNNIIWILLMTGANWLGSMIGYDKVIQTITQIKSSKKDPVTEKG